MPAIVNPMKICTINRTQPVLVLNYQHENEKIINRNEKLQNKSIKLDYLNKYPFFLDCKNYYKSKYNATSASAYDYSKPAENFTHHTRFLRAVIVYLPIDKIDEFKNEFKWFYRSWINIQKHEPRKWRTDLVVFVKNDKNILKSFYDSDSFFLEKMNCSFKNRRKSLHDLPMCTLIDHVPIQDRLIEHMIGKEFKDERLKYDYLLRNVDIFNTNQNYSDRYLFYDLLKSTLKNYNYADSILMAYDGYEYFQEVQYDFLIRSDLDVFLMPLFGYV
jgi:hypothetical protein